MTSTLIVQPAVITAIKPYQTAKATGKCLSPHMKSDIIEAHAHTLWIWCSYLALQTKDVICMPIWLSHLFVAWPISACLPFCLYVSIYLSICISVYLSVCLSFSLYPFIYLSNCLAVGLFVCVVCLIQSLHTTNSGSSHLSVCVAVLYPHANMHTDREIVRCSLSPLWLYIIWLSSHQVGPPEGTVVNKH